MQRNIIEEIIQLRDILPKKQKLLCNYIVLNHSQVGVMTVAELASKAKVGTTTVMRLVTLLHYDSFNSFKRDLLNSSIVHESSSYSAQKQSMLFVGGGENNALSEVANGISRGLGNLLTPNNFEQFERALELLLQAEHIYLLGMRSSRIAALHFEHSISGFYPKVRQLSNEQEYLYDRLLQITPKDVLLTISQWPCTKRTIEVAQVCNQKRIPVVLLTNTALNPIARIASAVIDTNSVGSTAELVLMTSVVEALAMEIGRRTAPQSAKNLEALEQMLRDNNLIIWESNP